jgi:hypothetical protein
MLYTNTQNENPTQHLNLQKRAKMPSKNIKKHKTSLQRAFRITLKLLFSFIKLYSKEQLLVFVGLAKFF